ncbi:MAG: folylpolyglutamate synthase [Sclerophora amabilis]|nr:MAG: folylpolyglutamate synthase [Sclerophora amabilis]
MIELGLARIGRLLKHTKLPWKAIHVAGTNGKGSICAYTSAMLRAAGLRSGRFTSPHLIDRWDCISVDEQTIDESVFREVEDRIAARNVREAIGASEFELLTATAFEVFTRADVEVGVVEVGMGGRLDATNILTDPLVTVIAKVGLDHQTMLGQTVEEIAWQKAGIMKPGVPCVVDGTNEGGVLKVLRGYAEDVGAGDVVTVTEESATWHASQATTTSSSIQPPHQQANLACALEAMRITMRSLGLHTAPLTDLAQTARQVVWPGRLQTLSIEQLTGRRKPVLIDGAHNHQSAQALASHIRSTGIRLASRPITWVVAFSQGKAVESMLRLLLQPGDNVVAVQFGAVDGMPWVSAKKTSEVLEELGKVDRDLSLGHQHGAATDVLGALRWASEVAGEDPIVVAGSLYLVGDVMRLLRNALPG